MSYLLSLFGCKAHFVDFQGERLSFLYSRTFRSILQLFHFCSMLRYIDTIGSSFQGQFLKRIVE